MKEAFHGIAVFFIGGFGYALIELLWRGRTHWSMMFAGGICLLMMYIIFGSIDDLSLPRRALIGAFVITLVECAAGLILNRRLKMGIWDYSDQKLNIMGQICPMYTVLWGILSIPASWICIRLKRLFCKNGAAVAAPPSVKCVEGSYHGGF